MPIIQSRFLRLLEAGEQYRDHYKVLHRNISRNLNLLSAKRITLEQFHSAIAGDLTVAPEYMPADAVLIEERTRYEYTYRKNQDERERMHLKRTVEGVPARKQRPRRYTQIPNPPPLARPVLPPEAQRILADMEAESNEIDAAMRAETEIDQTAIPDETLTQPETWTEADEAEYRKVMGKEPR